MTKYTKAELRFCYSQRWDYMIDWINDSSKLMGLVNAFDTDQPTGLDTYYYIYSIPEWDKIKDKKLARLLL